MSRPDGLPPLRSLLPKRRRLDRDIEEEIAFHLRMAERELLEAGLELEAAGREARRRFGDLDRHRQACRRIGVRRQGAERRGRLMNDLLLDLKFAFRTFRQSPGFVAVAVLTLGIGLSGNAVIFGMVNGLVLTPLPYSDSDELVVVWTTDATRPDARSNASAPDIADWRQTNEVFEDLSAHGAWPVNLTGVDRPERLQGYRVTANLFELLAVEPAHGRALVAADDEPGADPVVLLNHRIWNARFGADPGLVGRTIELDGVPHRVVGVMPPKFEFPQFQFRGDLWAPLQLTAEQLTETRGNRWLTVTGRLRDGVTVERAQAEMDGITARLADTYPDTNANRGALVIRIGDQMAEPMLPALIVLPMMVTFVLLICCANVANLFLARTGSRQAELAVRHALGASRWRIVRQLLTESVVVALLGGAVGILLSRVAERLVAVSLPDFVHEVAPSALEAEADLRIFAFTLVSAVLTGILFGLVPALRASRPDVQETMKGGSPGIVTELRGNRLRGLLVASQVAMSVVLVIGAALMTKAFLRIAEVDPGFEPEGVLTASVALPESKYPTEEDVRRFFDGSVARADALPGVERAAAASILPLSLSNTTAMFLVEGEPEPLPGEFPWAGRRVVTPGYFAAMGVPVLRGRDLGDGDTEGAVPVVVVNEELVERYFGDGDPIGRRIRGRGSDTWMEIVGVVGDMRHTSLAFGPEPEMFVPFAQWPRRNLSLVMRTAVEPTSLTRALEQSIWAIDPDQPIDDVRALDEIVSSSLFIFRLPVGFMIAFALVALLLAGVGLYGVTAYLVSRRWRELGVRKALGASRPTLVRLMLRRAMPMAAAGLLVGAALSIAVGLVVASVVQGVTLADPVTFLGVPAIIALVVLLAAWMPARHAATVDPVTALRAP